MALEPIKYDAHGAAIEAEWLKVVRGGEIEWLVIAPEKQGEYYPHAVGTGFSEFLASFHDDGDGDSQVRYGIARVSPPGSDVQKVLLVGWCPDGATMKMRASFAANFGTVANNLLKGYHVQVSARDEDDLDEKELLMKISNASGARYSIQSVSGATTASGSGSVKKLSPPTASPAAPSSTTASSTPAKTIPVKKEIAASSKKEEDDDDWDEPAVEERDLEREPLKKPAASNAYKPIGKVDLQKTIAEETAREDPRLVKVSPAEDIANLKRKQQEQRDAELNKFSAATSAAVPSSIPRDDDKVIRGFKTEKTPAQLWAERKARENSGAGASGATPAAAPETKAETKADDKNEDEAVEQEDVKDLRSKFENLATEPPIIQPRKVDAPAPVKDEPVNDVIQAKKPVGVPLPGMHNEDDGDEEDDDDWDEEEKEEKPAPSLPKREEPKEEPVPEPEPKEEEPEEEPPRDDTPPLPKRDETPPLPKREETPQKETPQARAVPPPPPRREEKKEEEKKPWAVAEYDYEAAEDNELTFAENDKIVNIEFVDDDWWLGELESGEKGLFPSNYVSLGN